MAASPATAASSRVPRIGVRASIVVSTATYTTASQAPSATMARTGSSQPMARSASENERIGVPPAVVKIADVGADAHSTHGGPMRLPFLAERDMGDRVAGSRQPAQPIRVRFGVSRRQAENRAARREPAWDDAEQALEWQRDDRLKSRQDVLDAPQLAGRGGGCQVCLLYTSPSPR